MEPSPIGILEEDKGGILEGEPGVVGLLSRSFRFDHIDYIVEFTYLVSMVSASESSTASESETASDTYPFGLESYVSSCGLEMSFSSIVVWSGL